MKKILGLILVFCLCLSVFSVSVTGLDFSRINNTVVLAISTPNVIVNGQSGVVDSSNLNVMPLIVGGRTLVPVRFISESFGGDVGFDDESRTVTLQFSDVLISLTLDHNIMYVGGQEVQLDTPAQAIENRTMIPLRALVESLGKSVFWDDKGLIVISDQEDILNSENDADLIDSILYILRIGGELPAAEIPAGGIFDQKSIEEIIDFDRVEEAFNLRGGLPNFNEKLVNHPNAEINVAFIGGSITQAEGFRTLTMQYLNERYGNRFNFLNAGVSGTASDFGAIRLATDVFSFEPDLLIIEFAVNDNVFLRDGQLHSMAGIAGMEGIVRQIWTENPYTDILFVYTLTEAFVPVAAEGRYTFTAKVQDFIAEHYNIPSVFMGHDLAVKAQNGEIIFNSSNPDDARGAVFSNDGVHPNRDGSAMYFEVLERALFDLIGRGRTTVIGAVPHQLPDILYSNNLGNLVTLSPADVTLSDGFERIEIAGTEYARAWSNRGTYLFQATEVGESVSVTFEGTQVGIFFVTGPGAPNIDVIINGEKIADLSLFNQWDGITGYVVSHYMTPPLPHGIHTVELKINDTVTDKAELVRQTGTGPVVDQRLARIEHLPELFEARNFLVGKVIINGVKAD